MPRLRIRLLGPPEVSVNEQPLDTVPSKALALLAYLAVEADHLHRREALAGLLWPEWPERSARTNLRNTLSTLRATIGDRDAVCPCLLVTRETIQFNPECDAWVDVRAFGRLAGVGEVDEERGHPLAEAIALYRGPFLEGFSMDDSPAFEEWALLVRERLERKLLEAFGCLSEYHEQREEYDRACELAWRWVELAPWQEQGHRALMRGLALSGQRDLALAQYQACCRALREGLDAEPSAEMADLYERIRGGTLTGRVEEPPPAVPTEEEPQRRSNLPVSLTPLIGRERELAEIGERLADPNCRLLTLTGPGGSGKTRLSVETAAQAVGAGSQTCPYEHGVYFVPLAPLDSAEAIVPAIARAIDFSFYAAEGTPDTKQQLLDYLRRKAMLLVLDNYEHLLEGAGLVAEILQAAPQVQILVTSRTRLGLSGEQLFPVGALDLPEEAPRKPTEWHAIAASTQSDAVRLFVSAAQRAWPDFELTADNLPHVVRVCRLVEGMPLGILLAAAWANVLQPAEIAAELGQSLDFLAAEWRDLPPRQRSMRAVFDHSWRLLTAREQEVMGALSVFRGSFAREAAREVGGASLRDLMGLVNRSLLGHTPGGRYELHELLRQYAAEQLERLPDGGKGAHARHAAHYAAALERWAEDLKGPRQQGALAAIEADLDNARAAWTWAVERGAVEVLDQAAEGLGMFYDWRMRLEEGEAVFGPAAEALSGADSVDALRVRVKMLAWRASFISDQERVNSTVRHCLALLERPELADHDTRRERALALKQAGKLQVRMGRSDQRYAQEVARYLEQSLALYREVGDRWQVSDVLLLFGVAKGWIGGQEETVQCFEEGLAIARSLGDRRGTARHLLQTALTGFVRGQIDRGERLARESIDVLRETGDRYDIAWGIHWLGIISYYCGRFVEACSTEEESLRMLYDLGRDDPPFGVKLYLGAAEMHLGRYEEARAHLDDYLAMSTRVDPKFGIMLTHACLGEMAMVTGEYDRADRLLQESLALARQRGSKGDVIQALNDLACNAHKMGEAKQAKGYLVEALRVPPGIYSLRPSYLGPLAAMALLLIDEGDVERAVELYALASCNPFVANSRWFEDVAGKEIAAAAETLPPEAVAAAQERGRARDLWETARELLDELEAEQV